MITIIALFDIQSHDSPVAIGAPMHGETGLQIGQTPKHEREPRQQSSENEEKPLLRGGAMVESEPVASGVRWPKSNWEIPDTTMLLLAAANLSSD